jgi:hypothetical protein
MEISKGYSGFRLYGDLLCLHNDQDNVVVSKEGIVKITDFGCATMLRDFPVTFTATESLSYSVRWAVSLC